MLEFLKVRNVQSHAYSVLRFCAGVNIIVGASQAGKTAMFRAFRQLVLNRPLGLSLKSDFSKVEKPTSISVKNNFGTTISLTKLEKTSRYAVINESGKRSTFRKFKGSVPDLVKTALNIDFDLSFQDQLHPYSVFESSVNLGKRIDSVIGTEKLENWIDKTSKRLFAKKRKMKYLKSELLENEEKFKRYNGLESLRKDIKHYSVLVKRSDRLDERLRELGVLRLKHLDIKSNIKRLNKYSVLLDLIDLVKQSYGEMMELNEKKRVLQSYKNITSTISQMESCVSSLKVQYERELLNRKVCPLCFSKINKERAKTIIKNI